VTDIGVLPGQGFAIVVIATETGVFAAYIKKGGDVGALTVTSE